ncbi:hypothetical protein Patl1_19104 [Pistacia atlantica]|uniref:Uncharacterized protein n=1 Tax=Pistacia atlantica TaxID=434234 RepID=A0ACC1C2R8_9ROSI|nr:hypothetical protein Patl1_19104 [Pistacia atlantica]
MRKLRIIYHDPEATDSSSEDDDDYHHRRTQFHGVKRYVTEISLPGSLHEASGENSLQQNVVEGKTMSEETKDTFSHPSPSSVLDVTTSASLANAFGDRIKEENGIGEEFVKGCNVEKAARRECNYEDEQSISYLLKVPDLSPSMSEDLGDFGFEDMFKQCQDDYGQFYGVPNQNYIEDSCVVEDLGNGVVISNLFDIEPSLEDFAWADGTLSFSC